MRQHYLYRLWLDGKIQYIGRATNVKQRISAHKKDKLFDHADYILVDKCDMDKIEMYFIKKELPPLNKEINTFLAGKGYGIFKHKYLNCEFIPVTHGKGIGKQDDLEIDPTINKLEIESRPICLSSSLLMADTILNIKNDLLFNLNMVDKVTYSYINEMVISSMAYEYTVNDFDNNLSNNIGIEREIFESAVKKLEDIGLIVTTTEETENGIKTTYFSDSLFSGNFKLFTKQYSDNRLEHTNEGVEITMDKSRGICRPEFSAH